SVVLFPGARRRGTWGSHGRGRTLGVAPGPPAKAKVHWLPRDECGNRSRRWKCRLLGIDQTDFHILTATTTTTNEVIFRTDGLRDTHSEGNLRIHFLVHKIDLGGKLADGTKRGGSERYNITQKAHVQIWYASQYRTQYEDG
ncbi:MAG: hypothetical protein KGJ51_05470, partial [Acidobacteriota bacterium]|nr:hypothetical protein [Acidobacteriota bacterium]